MARTLPLALILLTVLLTAGCATTGLGTMPDTNMTPASLDSKWSGVWIELWPDSDQHDRYQITVDEAAKSIDIVPLTNAERQHLADVTWDGSTLEFTNAIADDRQIFYAMAINGDGTELSGTVRSNSGDINHITWTKDTPGIAAAAPRNLVQTEGEFIDVDFDDFAGNWQENWPGHSENDVYRLRVDRRRIEFEVLSNIEKQTIAGLEWSGGRLAFDLYYNEDAFHYELFLNTPDELVGVVTLPNGQSRRITWDRVGPADVSTRVRPGSWEGSWIEFWPGRAEHDVYRLTVDRGDKLAVHTVTNTERQTLDGVQFTGAALSFQLKFANNTIVYELKMEDSNTVRGTVRTLDGKIRQVVWLRNNK
jgi:hypothetical protein